MFMFPTTFESKHEHLAPGGNRRKTLVTFRAPWPAPGKGEMAPQPLRAPQAAPVLGLALGAFSALDRSLCALWPHRLPRDRPVPRPLPSDPQGGVPPPLCADRSA